MFWADYTFSWIGPRTFVYSRTEDGRWIDEEACSVLRTAANITKKLLLCINATAKLAARTSEQTQWGSEHGSKMHPRIVTIRGEEEETKTRVPAEWD